MSERENLEQAIAHLETQRVVLGDAVVDASILALRRQLATLEPLPAAEQQRKQVAVLLADISGSTAMAETMDAEDVTEIMNALWKRLDRVIVEHGGKIDKHMGDAVLALWGAETAREDDPEQAIRAALVIQAELAAFREDRGVNLAMRIGINTGPVLMSPVGTTGEYTAMGDTVNTASRLEHAAPVGGVLISHATYRHVRGIFDVQSLESIQVKGKAESIQVYVVQRAKPRAFRRATRGVEGIETHMVGREEELAQLQDAFYKAVQDGQRQVVTIAGEAGVGKSRLLYEFENWADLLPETIRYFKGRASLEMQNVPYALVRDLFSSRFQIQDSDRSSVVWEKMECGTGEAVSEDHRGQMYAHFIGQLLGFDFSTSPYLAGILDDAQQIRDRALIYISDYFKATAAQTPVLILLEDLHWADQSSLDVLDHLALATPEQSLLVLSTARPTLFERRPHWGEGQAFHTRLALRPLSQRDTHRLVDEVLRLAERVPEDLRELVVSGAEGNPFYVEELIKMLIEDGVILTEEQRWRIEPQRLTTVRVPSTLVGVLQARLDSLPPEERTILQRASVVGRKFWDSAVERISESAPVDVGAEALYSEQSPLPVEELVGGISDNLSALRDKELIFRREPSAFAGTQEYLFKHAILREVTYESVLKRLRRIYHGLIGEWLIQHSAERVGEVAGLIADHLELAGEIGRATTYLRRAGERAAAQFANAEAVNYLSRALDLTPEKDAAERYVLLLAREKVYDLQGERQAQSQDLATLGELAEILADDRRCAEVALRQAQYAEVTGDYPAAIAVAQQAIHLAQVAQDVACEAMACLSWGRALVRQGDYEAARHRLEQALSLGNASRSRQIEAEGLHILGIVCHYQGDYGGARAYYQQALRISREIGSRRGESNALSNLGRISTEQGDQAAAGAYYDQALHISREIGHRVGEVSALNSLGIICAQQGDYGAAKTCFEQTTRISREINNRLYEGSALCNLGDLCAGQGDYVAALAYYERALQILREIGYRQGEGEILANLSLTSHQLGDDKAALEYSQQALLIAQELGDRHIQGYALMHMGHALARMGLAVKAVNNYRKALALRRELGQPKLVVESLAGLAHVSLVQDDLAQAQAQVEQILDFLESDTLEGTSEPFRVYLVCYRVLLASRDTRARDVLETAFHLLQERTAKIDDEELRRSFVENVPVHREILAAWEGQGSEKGG
jgi:predicted ATPase/class 3 adenylate cyclase